jgi:hypothetical protein
MVWPKKPAEWVMKDTFGTISGVLGIVQLLVVGGFLLLIGPLLLVGAGNFFWEALEQAWVHGLSPQAPLEPFLLPVGLAAFAMYPTGMLIMFLLFWLKENDQMPGPLRRFFGEGALTEIFQELAPATRVSAHTHLRTNFRENVAPFLDRIEQYRQQVLAARRRRVRFGMLLFAAALCLSICLLYFGVEAVTLNAILIWGLVNVFFFVALLLAVWYAARGPVANFSDRLKDFLMQAACQQFAYLRYERKGESLADVDRFEKLGMLPAGSRTIKDALSGEADGRDFVWAEIKITRQSGSDSSSSTTTVFEGFVLSVELDRRFNGQILIVRRSNSALRQAAEKMLQQIRAALHQGRPEGPAEVDGILTGNADFDADFEILTQDEALARRLVTNVFAQRLLAISDRYDTGGVAGAFLAGKFLLSVDTEVDRFEGINADTPAAKYYDVLSGLHSEIEEIRALVLSL